MKKISHVGKVSREVEESIHYILDLAMNEKARGKLHPIHNGTKFKENLRKEVNVEIAKNFDEFNRRFGLGVDAVLEQMRHCHDKKGIDQITDEVQKVVAMFQDKHHEVKFFDEYLEKCPTIKVFLGLSNSSVEELYKAARTLYNEKKYEEASNSFYFLSALDPIVPAFWMGYGSSEHHLEQYKAALFAFATAALLNSADPAPHYFAAESFIALSDTSGAISSLNLALKSSKQDPAAESVKTAALKLKNKLLKG